MTLVHDATRDELFTEAEGANVTTDQVWDAIEAHNFAVVAYVTPAGAPRATGVMYKPVDRHLYLVVASDSWKARHIRRDQRVAVTVLARRGGLLSLLFPIPPATINFHGKAVVHAAGSATADAIADDLGAMLPEDRRTDCDVIEIVPEGEFVTYGIGVSLGAMRDTLKARGRVSTG